MGALKTSERHGRLEVDPVPVFPFNIVNVSLLTFLPNSCILRVFGREVSSLSRRGRGGCS